MRREFNARTRAKAFERAAGKCEDCGAKLSLGKYQFDHDNPDGLTGEPTLENCVVRCTPCHAEKTKHDVARIAQAKRREARHLGFKAPKRPIQSAPFAKAEPARRASTSLLKRLPDRARPLIVSGDL